MRKPIFALLFCTAPVLADPPVIESVKGQRDGETWRFDVTLSHGDTGWDDYADGWRVLDMQGNELGVRTLLHPHVEEQPFTRSLGNVQIPKDAAQVQVEARDKIGGWSGETVVYTLP